MASITIDGPLTDVPAHEDGSPYAFALANAESTLFADTRTEVIADLLEGYGDIPEGEEGDNMALIARHESALVLASRLQEMLAASAVNEGRWDHANASEDVLTAIFTPRSEGVVFDGQEWTEPVPLVLVSTSFAPVTERPRIEGNVLWIDPFTETTFLQTLGEAGLIDMRVQAEG